MSKNWQITKLEENGVQIKPPSEEISFGRMDSSTVPKIFRLYANVFEVY